MQSRALFTLFWLQGSAANAALAEAAKQHANQQALAGRLVRENSSGIREPEFRRACIMPLCSRSMNRRPMRSLLHVFMQQTGCVVSAVVSVGRLFGFGVGFRVNPQTQQCAGGGGGSGGSETHCYWCGPPLGVSRPAAEERQVKPKNLQFCEWHS